MQKYPRSAYRRYLVSYSAIAIIPVMVVVLAVMAVINANHENVAKDLFRRSVQQAANHLDGLINEMSLAAMDFAVHNSIQSHTSARAQPETAAGMIAQVNKIEQHLRVPSTVLYYGLGETYLVTSSRLLSYQMMESEWSHLVDLNMSSFFRGINSIQTGTSWRLEPAGIRSVQDSSFSAFAFPCYDTDASRTGTLIFLVEEKDLNNIMAEYVGTQPAYFYLYSPQLNLVSHLELQSQSDHARAQILRHATATVTNVQISQHRFQALRYRTDIAAYQLVLCSDLATLYGDISQLRKGTLLLGLAVICLVIVFAVLLARHSYRPVRSLINTIGLQEDQESRNEFAMIHQHLRITSDAVFALNEKLALQRPMMRDRTLLSLLRGSIHPDLKQQMQTVFPDLDLLDRKACVALIYAQRRALMAGQAQLERIVIPGVATHGVYIADEGVFALLLMQHGSQDRRVELGTALQNALANQGLEDPRVGLGGMATGPEQIPTSFLQAYIALNRAKGKSFSLFDPELEEDKPDREMHSIGSAADIYLQSLRSVDARTANKLLLALLQEMQDSPASVLNASYQRFQLFSSALSASEQNTALRLQEQATDVSVFSDEEAFRELMLRLTEDNCAEVSRRRDDAQAAASKRILSTLKKHCFEPSFSLSRLAELTESSAAQINRSLKDETGYSFLQLVSLFRIERAKAELLQTDDKIKDIVAHVGYLDLASFTRKFREMEGLTPGEYREALRTNHKQNPR